MRGSGVSVWFAVGAALALSACGSSEFETRTLAWCESSGMKERVDCACLASTFGSALGSEDKEIFLKARVAGTGSAAQVERAVKDVSGIDSKADNDGFRARLRAFLDAENAASDEVKKACSKS